MNNETEREAQVKQSFWLSPVPALDDFELPIADEFIDGKTVYGPWAMMSPEAFALHGTGRLGLGVGQRYQRQPVTNRWLKVEG